MDINWNTVKEGTEIELIFDHRISCKFVEIDPTDPTYIRYKYYWEVDSRWFYAYGTMDFFKLKPKVLFEV
jgi:hypothetical protein